jgi:hypothetical protein
MPDLVRDLDSFIRAGKTLRRGVVGAAPRDELPPVDDWEADVHAWAEARGEDMFFAVRILSTGRDYRSPQTWDSSMGTNALADALWLDRRANHLATIDALLRALDYIKGIAGTVPPDSAGVAPKRGGGPPRGGGLTIEGLRKALDSWRADHRREWPPTQPALGDIELKGLSARRIGQVLHAAGTTWDLEIGAAEGRG